MNAANKLGITGLICAFISIIGGPVGLALAVIAFVLGSTAAQRGRKWWLIVPCPVTVAMAILLYVGFHAE